jgi:hypothetical protein
MALTFIVVASLAGLLLVVVDMVAGERRRRRALRGHIVPTDTRRGH